MKIRIRIGAIVLALRKAKKMTIREVADKAGFNHSNYSRYERGMAGGPKMPEGLYPLAEVFGTRVAVLFMLQAKVTESPWYLDDPDALLRKMSIYNLAVKRADDIERLVSYQEALHRVDTTDEFLKLTEAWDEHPDDYDGPCRCTLCRQYEAES